MLRPVTNKTARIGQKIVDRSQDNRKGVIIDPIEVGAWSDPDNSAVFAVPFGYRIAVQWSDTGVVSTVDIITIDKPAVATIFEKVIDPFSTEQKDKLTKLLQSINKRS